MNINEIIKNDLDSFEKTVLIDKWNGYINPQTGLQILQDSGTKTSSGKKLYLVRCVCGHDFLARLDDIKSGRVKSCGCLSNKAKVKSIHYDRAYEILRRCNNPLALNYNDYGGRGIKCLLGNTPKEVAAQLETLPGYKPDLELDRIDVNGDYTFEHPEHGTDVYVDKYGCICKGNLRWVTRRLGNLNKRNSLSLMDLATKYRPLKYIQQTIKAHCYSVSEFLFHMVYSEHHKRNIAIALHRSIVLEYVQRLFSKEKNESSDSGTLGLPTSIREFKDGAIERIPFEDDSTCEIGR